MAPPQRLRVQQSQAPAACRLERGPDGLRLAPAPAPPGLLEGPALALQAAAPYPAPAMCATAGGRILLAWGPGFARTVLVPDLAQAFDRRPPGLRAAIGAAGANAALLEADDGWRAVVLPSLGDRLADLGPGPVAIAASGLRLAVSGAGAVRELALADGAEHATHPGEAEALAFAGDDLLVARGGAVGGAATAPGDGPPVRALRGAAEAPVALALLGDGRLVRHDPGGPGEPWESPVGPVADLSLDAEGTWATLAGADAVAVVRAADGAVAAHIAGPTSVALVAGGRIAIGGEWGVALVAPAKEDA
jgi:hypothetical protein